MNHDALRVDPTGMLSAIFDVLGVHADAESLAKQIDSPSSNAESNNKFDTELLLRAEATYRSLLDSPNNLVG